MATNDFLPFAVGGGANVLTQAQYNALAATLVASGFTAGVAPSVQLNKVWRQSSIMAAVLGALINDATGQNATDDGTTATLESNLLAAMMKAGYADDAGVANAYVVTLTPAVLAYYDGLMVGFSTVNPNTLNNPTVNVNGLGVVPITAPGGQSIGLGQISANSVQWFAYNSAGPRFEIQQDFVPLSNIPYAGATGTSDAVTALYQVSSPTLVDGYTLSLKVVTPNATATPTFAPTLNGAAQTASTVVKLWGGAGVPLFAGELMGDVTLVYDLPNTRWILLNPAPIAVKSVNLTNLLHPTRSGGWRDTLRSKWLPAWFNQQWGGAQVGGLPDGLNWGDVATGNIQDDDSIAQGVNTGEINVSQRFILSEAQSNPIVQLKLFKSGAPTDTILIGIYSDVGGIPGVLIGATASISAVFITSKTDGEWYSFTPTPGALSAGTPYHIVISRTGALDPTNYINVKNCSSIKYPYGRMCYSNSTPAWIVATNVVCFLIQNTTTTQVINTGGKWDAKVRFNEGAPLSQSSYLQHELCSLMDSSSHTIAISGQGFIHGKTLYNAAYGVDHDRIAITTDAVTGVAVLTYYDSTSTPHTVTGVTDLTTGAFFSIGYRIRTVGDGADYLTLYVNGASEGTALVAQTFTDESLMKTLGNATLGGGFQLAPAWTQNMSFATLPSAQGWTWSGSGTVGNCMVLDGTGKMRQVAAGYAATDWGYWSKTTTLSNATGWTVIWKCRVESSSNGATNEAVEIIVQDGVRVIRIAISEYFLTSLNAATNAIVQGDFKSQEHVFIVSGKGNDYYLYIDNKLAIDGTGQMTTTSALNSLTFGDNDNASGNNADVTWSYFKYYQGAFLPNAHSGASVSEFASWSGDMSSLLPLAYNAGTQVSIKQLCGVEQNYVGSDYETTTYRKGVSSSVSATSTTPVIVADMDCFVLGEQFDFEQSLGLVENSITPSTTLACISIDSAIPSISAQNVLLPPVTRQDYPVAGASLYLNSRQDGLHTYVGLHKVQGTMWANTGTITTYYNARTLTVKSK